MIFRMLQSQAACKHDFPGLQSHLRGHSSEISLVPGTKTYKGVDDRLHKPVLMISLKSHPFCSSSAGTVKDNPCL